jgi:hypothetical protein
MERDATWAYRDRFDDAFARTYFRRFGPGVVSSIGVGTHLGTPAAQFRERFVELGLFASAPLGGGGLADAATIPGAVDARLAGDSPVQRAINFARSAPAVTSALVGTTDVDYLDENVAAGTFEPSGAAAFDATFE